MTQFDLQRLEVEAKATAEITLYEIPWEPPPVLVVRPASESNPDYNNEFLKRITRVREASGGTIGHREHVQYREIDRELYPRTVVTGWKHVQDAAGKDVPFSPVEAAAFFKALPRRVLGRIRAFCQNESNFVDEIHDPVLEGNSESGSDSD